MSGQHAGDGLGPADIPVPDPAAGPATPEPAETETGTEVALRQETAPARVAPASPETPPADDWRAALAAEVAARIEEVDREIAAALEARARAEEERLIEVDAGIAAERQWAQSHNPVALAAIDSRNADVRGIIAAMRPRTVQGTAA